MGKTKDWLGWNKNDDVLEEGAIYWFSQKRTSSSHHDK